MKLWKSVLFIASIFFAIISCYQTALGYEILMGKTIAWLGSILISLILIALNRVFIFQEYDGRGKSKDVFPTTYEEVEENNISIKGFILTYCLFAGVSFVGNFNAFYSQFMKTELYDYELKEAFTKTKVTYEKAIQTLKNPITEAEKLENNINIERDKLKRQILDRGCGNRCEEILETISSLMKVPPFTITQKSPADLAKDLDEQIIRALENTKKSMISQSEKKSNEIKNVYGNLDDAVEVTLNPQNIEEKGQSMIDRCIKTNNEIGAKVRAISPNFVFEEIKAKNTQIGKINHSFASAWECMCTASIFIFFASLFIDFAVPIATWITLPKSKKGGNKTIVGDSIL